ncbi:DNA ligase (NAD+) [Acetitomaculum ruminis DSM 5522]|uniref:DNA ligase n=1 Tax=Acetitomaculum ruminis DSM 5522 TaxID=1120918 RepID=A0A1I0VVE5_9FIRM|nr:NAD-dependent DNA ligase LigA [Acetitomaculum ruminis]SFA79656.1 DNA ligase (NAD+) [Acetitomaculum ruminis DSM 5522]
MDKLDRIKELINILNEASKAYYQGEKEIMTNLEYDALYDELEKLQNETGIVPANSPTVNVGYEVLSNLEKERHESPMLSLDKTKEVESLKSFLNGKEAVLSWKLDGLTVVLTYENGELAKAVTRGNGEIGEVITQNARTFKNIPLKIPFKKKLVIRAEAVIKYVDFEQINESLEAKDKFKNPRNLCSGSVRQLDSSITAKRNVNAIVFALVSAEDVEFGNSRMNQFEWLSNQGFEVVYHQLVNPDNLEDAVKNFESKIADNSFPSDGLVLVLEDISYGESLGTTAKFPRNAMAFKWKDEIAKTHLLDIEWSASRTGLLNPVAVFEPVELEGTTVSRASVHNVSILKELKLGIGDEISVYKANMIIPQIASNETESGNCSIPDKCPVCGGNTEIKKVNDGEFLYCKNPLCIAKKIKQLSLMVSRDALNIEGLSEATLEKFINQGIIHNVTDLFSLSDSKERIVEMEGFGEKSYENLVKEIENKKETNLYRIIYALGIPNIGLSMAKLICKNFEDDPEKVIYAKEEELLSISGIGDILAKSFTQYFQNPENLSLYNNLLNNIKLVKETNDTPQKFAGKTFVITGSVNHFANRNELKAEIEKMGGKVTGSVTKNTDYLINNDITSNSSKNKKAKELGIPIITEEEYLKM